MTTLDELDNRRPPASFSGWTAFGFGVGYGLGRIAVKIGGQWLAKQVFARLYMLMRRVRDYRPSRASAFRRPGEIPPGAIMTAAFVLVALSSFLLGVWLF